MSPIWELLDKPISIARVKTLASAPLPEGGERSVDEGAKLLAPLVAAPPRGDWQGDSPRLDTLAGRQFWA